MDTKRILARLVLKKSMNGDQGGKHAWEFLAKTSERNPRMEGGDNGEFVSTCYVKVKREISRLR